MFVEKIGEAAVFEGIAEEAVELAHEAQKLARILRRQNPTDADVSKTVDNIIVEYTHLRLYLDDVGFEPSESVRKKAIERFEGRISSARKNIQE